MTIFFFIIDYHVEHNKQGIVGIRETNDNDPLPIRNTQPLTTIN